MTTVNLVRTVLSQPLPAVPAAPPVHRFPAVVLAAGVGNRLRPLTDGLCKPLVPVLNVPALYWTTASLVAAGAHVVAVNAYHLARQIEAAADHLRARASTELRVVREGRLSGPVGGIMACQRVLPPSPYHVVVSGDAVTDLDLGDIVADHVAHDADLTMFAQPVDDPGRFGLLRLGADGCEILGMEEKPDRSPTGAVINCGIYVFSERALRTLRVPPGAAGAYDVKHLVPQLLAAGMRLRAFRSAAYWCDIGTVPAYLQAGLHFLAGPGLPRVAARDVARAGLWAQGRYELARGVRLDGRVLLGDGARIGRGAVLSRSVIGPGARIGAGAELSDVVVRPGAVVPEGARLDGTVFW